MNDTITITSTSTSKILAVLPVAGTKHYDAKNVTLAVGNPLRFFREATNPHDRFAVAIIFIDLKGQEHKLGYIPATHSQIFSTLLDNNIPLSCSVSALIPKSYNPILISISLA